MAFSLFMESLRKCYNLIARSDSEHLFIGRGFRNTCNKDLGIPVTYVCITYIGIPKTSPNE